MRQPEDVAEHTSTVTSSLLTTTATRGTDDSSSGPWCNAEGSFEPAGRAGLARVWHRDAEGALRT
jgi:hypothetical protein